MTVGIGSWQPNQRLAETLSDAPPADSGHYLFADDQKRVVQQMSVNYDFIVAQAIRGTPSRVIAIGHGVTREAIDKRLRPLGLKNPPGVLGRPAKKYLP